MNACKPVLEELYEVIQSDEDSIEPKPVLTNNDNVTLNAVDLTYRYSDSDRNVIDHFTYTFENGHKYLIQGESGRGKTTLAKLLAGEINPITGGIDVNGVSVALLGEKQKFEILNYIDQKSYLFGDSIMNNIGMYRELPQDLVLLTMKYLGLDNLESDKIIDDNNGISGGQKSRICLARAIVDLPNVLIVDEPTAALDAENSLLVMKYLCSLPITVIVISHNYDKQILDLFDEIIKL